MLYSVWISIAYIIGIITGLTLDIALSLVSFFMVICAMLGWHFKRKGQNRKEDKDRLVYLLGAIVFLFFGIVYSKIRLCDFETRYKEGAIDTKGKILSAGKESRYYQQYLFQNERGNQFLLYIKKEVTTYTENTSLRVRGEFQKPDGQRNSGGFDYAKYLYAQGIYGCIFVREKGIVETLAKEPFSFMTAVQKDICDVFQKLLPTEPFSVLLCMTVRKFFFFV